MIQVVSPATEHQALSMLGRIRQADLDEFAVGVAGNIVDGLRLGIAISDRTWAGVMDDTVICVCGVSPVKGMPGSGGVWLVSTYDMERAPRQFLRLSRRVLREMLTVYPHLFNWADARNTLAIKWLAWLGFTIYEPTPYGPYSIPFHFFEMRSNNV